MHVERWATPAGRTRLLVYMEPAAAVRYARAARLAVPRAVTAPRSYGSARRPDRAPRFDTERSAWRAALIRAAEPDAVAETGDVAACFPSIEERALRAASRAFGGDPGPLLEILRAVRDLGIAGLPIGPAASSFLADAVLSLADMDAERAGVVPIRWVDDVAFIGSRGDVARAARAWRHGLRELGLAPHEGKRTAMASATDLLAASGSGPSAVGTGSRGIIRL
jgi:hypothetical protein